MCVVIYASNRALLCSISFFLVGHFLFICLFWFASNYSAPLFPPFFPLCVLFDMHVCTSESFCDPLLLIRRQITRLSFFRFQWPRFSFPAASSVLCVCSPDKVSFPIPVYEFSSFKVLCRLFTVRSLLISGLNAITFPLSLYLHMVCLLNLFSPLNCFAYDLLSDSFDFSYFFILFVTFLRLIFFFSRLPLFSVCAFLDCQTMN